MTTFFHGHIWNKFEMLRMKILQRKIYFLYVIDNHLHIYLMYINKKNPMFEVKCYSKTRSTHQEQLKKNLKNLRFD
jgi:hypothetical protein